MIHEKAIAISVDHDGKFLAKVDRKGACEACQLKSACGQKLLSQASTKSCIEFEMDNEIGVEQGDLIEIGIPEKALIQASLIMYLVPLLSMMITALIADVWIGASELLVALSGLFGLGVGFYLVRVLSTKISKKAFEPNAIRVLNNKL